MGDRKFIVSYETGQRLQKVLNEFKILTWEQVFNKLVEEHYELKKLKNEAT